MCFAKKLSVNSALSVVEKEKQSTTEYTAFTEKKN